MNKKYWYILFVVIFFTIGAYVWKVTRPAVRLAGGRNAGINAYEPGRVLVYVGNKPITTDDLDWEYSLHTKGILNSKDLIPIPDLGDHYEQSLTSLKETLLSSIIERKMLYEFIKQDRGFDVTDTSRYVSCMEEWQDVLRHSGDLIAKKDRDRLKARLCEKSVLLQYMRERIFSQIQIIDTEVEDYYNNNKRKFHKPEMVVIKQIVLPTENEAREVMKGLTQANFSERAIEYSITPEGKDGGVLGPFARGDMPPILELAFEMPKGEIKGILKSTYGFHIIMLKEKISSKKLSLKEAEAEIRLTLLKRKKEEEYRKWVETAVNTISVRTPKSLW